MDALNQKKIFERVFESDLFTADELPPELDEMRKGPKLPKAKDEQQTNLLDGE